MKKLSLREIQLEEVKILKHLTDFLDKKHLKYSLAGGTLLGSIRHNGFIPWDDDIDIMMPRDDYQKLQTIIKENNNILKSNLFFHSFELHNLNLPFTKLCNYDIEIKDDRYKDRYQNYLWIDIFPIDYFPLNKLKAKFLCHMQKMYRTILWYKKVTFKHLCSKINFILPFKIIGKLMLYIIPMNFINRRMIKLSKSFKDSNYVGVSIWGYGLKELIPKSYIDKFIEVEFEGMRFKAIKNYDYYLSNLYSNYMVLPPKENRVAHNFIAWRVEDDKIKK